MALRKPTPDMGEPAPKPSDVVGDADKGAEDFNLAPPPPRFCSKKGCRNRLAQLVYDPHVLCVNCRGKKCDLGVRCEVCELWDNNTMAEYLAHQHKLELKRKPKKPSASQGSGTSGKSSSHVTGMSPDKQARLQESIEANLRNFLLQQQKELTKNVVSELKAVLTEGKSGSLNVDGSTDPIVDDVIDDIDDHDVPGPSGPPPAGPGPLVSWRDDSRYTRAKSLFDENCISAEALQSVALKCQAEAGQEYVEGDSIGPPPPKKPRSNYDPDDDPEFGVEPDFGDLLSCIISIYPDARDSEVVEKATEFLIGTATASNRREFIRLKFFREMSNCQKEVNERVSNVSVAQNKSFSIWPRKKRYYRVSSYPESVKINPRVAELAYMKNVPQNMSFSFSSSEALALDKALAELVQSQSFSFWLLSSFFAYLDQEDFSPSNPSLYYKFTTILSSCTQTQASWSLSLQSFLTLLRRKSIIAKFLPSVLLHQKESLMRSPCFSGDLFDEGVLEKVILEHNASQMSQSTISMAKFFTSSNFSKTPYAQAFHQRGQRRPYSRPHFVAVRGRGNRGGRGRGKKNNANRGKQANRGNPPKNA